MTDTEPAVDPDAITDLSQVRWLVRELDHEDEYAGRGSEGLHVIGEVGNAPDLYSREFFDLHLQKAEDGDGGDCSPWLADMVARKLSETDNGWRASWQRAVDEVNRTRTRMRVMDAAATNLLALWRDPSVCSPGMGFDIALGELARAMEERKP